MGQTEEEARQVKTSQLGDPGLEPLRPPHVCPDSLSLRIQVWLYLPQPLQVETWKRKTRSDSAEMNAQGRVTVWHFGTTETLVSTSGEYPVTGTSRKLA